MLTRRKMLTCVLPAGVLAGSRIGSAKASQPTTPVSFEVPAHACDCHTHIFGEPREFPLFSGRKYTPETALPNEMSSLHRALHVERVVIVTPSVYGTDNSATLFGMKARGQTARGVAVVDERTSEADLDGMHKAGMRGIRLNLLTGGSTDPQEGRRRFQQAVDRMQRRGWHVQIYGTLALISGIKDLVLTSPVPVVFDHFGGARAEAGLEQAGFNDLLQLLRSGKAYVKVSGAYLASSRGPDYPDAAPLARAIIAANADRVLWGTDWPHPDSAPHAGRKPTDLSPLQQIDDGRLMNQLAIWAPDAAVRRKILVENPAKLYGF